MGKAISTRWWQVSAVCVAGWAAGGVLADPVPTTVADFFNGGSQPNSLTQKLTSATVCSACHYDYNPDHEPFILWASSMMGQAARDPVWYAAMAISNQDAANSNELCIRCHAPQGWMAGRSGVPDGGALATSDFQGVSCSTCHRIIDPVYQPGQSPAVDEDILAALPDHPVSLGNASYVFDPLDRRRGPYDLPFDPHQWYRSPYHRTAELCGTCHDVSNPQMSRNPDGTYSLNALNAPHPTQNKHDMFPEQRTYSEWKMSTFATTPQPLGARYGSNQANVQTCQDCHMPRTTGMGCNPGIFPPQRDDLARHSFAGSNTWVLRAVRNLYPDDETYLTEEAVNAAIERNHEMLRDASDLELSRESGNLKVRIVNQTGHKLPTGYPEGRRMWINVRFFDAGGALVAERGAYDPATAVLSAGDTKVYEALYAMSPATAAAFGKEPGPYSGLIPIDTVTKDNRIPPRGFTNANFTAIQAQPVAYAYADGQYWDDTLFAVPAAARHGGRADVRIYYQTTSREYIEFLRDHNTSNTRGQIAYNQWALLGKSAPAEMDFQTFMFCPADLDDDGNYANGLHPDQAVSIDDLVAFLAGFELGDLGVDLDDGNGGGNPDQAVTIDDLIFFLIHFENGC